MVCVSLKRLAAAFIMTAAAVLLCMISSSADYADAEIYDTYNSLSESEYGELLEYAHSVAEKTGWNIAVELDPDGDFSSDSSAFNHCINKFESCFGSTADGVFFYCADHFVYIATSGDAACYISDREANNVSGLGDSIYKTDKVGSIKKVLDGIYAQYEGGRDASGGRSSYFSVEGAVGTGVIAAGIFVSITLIGYKKHEKPSASGYIDSKTVRFPVKRDIFIREYTTRHTNSSSGGGGSHSGHHHSGGGHHR